MFISKLTNGRRISNLLLVSCLLLMFLSFSIDITTDLGVSEGLFYLPVILLTLFIPQRWVTPASGILASMLIGIGFFFHGYGDGIPNLYYTTHLFSLVAVWITVALLYFFKHSRSELLFYREKLSVIVEQAQEGILIAQEGRNIIVANPKMQELSGYNESELVGKKTGKLFPGIGDSFIGGMAQENPAWNANSETRCNMRKQDGSQITIDLHTWNFELGKKRFTVCYVFDVTEKTEQAIALNKANSELKSYSDKLVTINAALEAHVQERTEALKHSVEKLEWINRRLQHEIMNKEEAVLALKESQMMMEAVAVNYPNGIVSVINKDFKLIYAHGREIESLGLRREDLIGALFLPLRNPDAADKIKPLLEQAFAGEKISFEYQNPKTGNYYLFHGVPLLNAGNEVNQILVVSQNITSMKNAELDMRKSLEKEHELNELKTRFVSTASHEFRTPLAAILSSATLISMYNADGDEPKRLKHAKRIASSVNNLTEILNDFLSLGKIEEGKIINQPISFDIIELCEEILEDIKAQLSNGQEIEVNYVTDATNIVVLDKMLLRNVLLNLLSNAVKYSPENSIIALNLLNERNKVTISVKDHGIGIPENDQKHLFESFFRAGNVENIKGTGMGLNIVKRYIEIMQGTIHFESHLNEGSQFTIEFNVP